MWKIRIEKSFRKSFKSLDGVTQKRVIAFLEEVQGGMPSPTQHPRFRPLQGTPGYGRFRIGNVRIGVSLDVANQTVHFRFIGRRGDFYKRFPPS